MKRWIGTAAICINDNNEVLMVLQGKPEEEKLWSVPSGGLENGETLEECCIREVWEETGYHVEVIEKVHEKIGVTFNVPVQVHYYVVKIVRGERKIQDPDGLIYKIEWKRLDELIDLPLSFPEDYELLHRCVNIECPLGND
ncbi:NUDIX hydrolase [Bacillus cereus]|uniref:NUDIX hydrolase n=1 Tax=Bacillus TaxID=1386 RepID=UPI00054EF138|nr:NUDIX hydrolase [Bacillus sp. UNC322MFChir4.1]